MVGIARTYRKAFRGLPRTVWIASIIALLNRAGTMVLPFLGLWLAEERGYDKVLIGLLLASWGAGSILGTWLGGLLTDRWGAKVVLARSLVLTALGFLALPYLSTPAAVGAGLFAVAVAGDAFRPAIMAHVAVAAPAGKATQGVALLRLFINAGMSSGPAVGGFLAAIDYHWIFRVDALTCLLAAAGSAWWLPALERVERAADSTATGGGSPWRDRQAMVLLGLSFSFALVFFQLLGAWPLYLARVVALSEPEIGILLASNAVLVMVFEMAVVALVPPSHQLRVAGWGVLIGCCGFAATGVVAGFWTAALSVVVWSVGEMLSLPLVSGLFMNRAPAGRAGQWMGAFAMNWAVAMLLAPVLGTLVWDTFGAGGLWGGVGGLGVVLFFGFRRLDRAWHHS
jgi:predicted MFS family arabinose efflux permease